MVTDMGRSEGWRPRLGFRGRSASCACMSTIHLRLLVSSYPQLPTHCASGRHMSHLWGVRAGCGAACSALHAHIVHFWELCAQDLAAPLHALRDHLSLIHI